MRDEILDFLKENRDQFVSGQAMSEACHVSRTAIWKHIEVLRKRGYVIESFTKKGYRLIQEPDLISPEEMEGVLQTKTFGRYYVYEERLESTNTIAKALAMDGAPEGTVVWQEAGIHRMEKVSGSVLFYDLTFYLWKHQNVPLWQG